VHDYENVPPPLPARTPEPEDTRLSLINNSGTLGNSHGKRWVHSFERGLEKMKNIMTPRSKKVKSHEPAVAKVSPSPGVILNLFKSIICSICQQTLHNVACGYQKDPDALFQSLKKAIEQMGIQCKVKG
jgi:hypothetical protein